MWQLGVGWDNLAGHSEEASAQMYKRHSNLAVHHRQLGMDQSLSSSAEYSSISSSPFCRNKLSRSLKRQQSLFISKFVFTLSCLYEPPSLWLWKFMLYNQKITSKQEKKLLKIFIIYSQLQRIRSISAAECEQDVWLLAIKYHTKSQSSFLDKLCFSFLFVLRKIFPSGCFLHFSVTSVSPCFKSVWFNWGQTTKTKQRSA